MTHEESGRSQEQVLRQLLEEERHLRQQAEEEKLEEKRFRQQVEEEKLEEKRFRQQAEEEKLEEKRLRQEAEKWVQRTSLPEFLDACHVYLSVGFSSRINYKTGTQGHPENAKSKLRPDNILEWTTFPQEQSRIWKDLFTTDFVSEGHFTSLNALKEAGEDMQQRSLGSELDLGYYERYAVEDRVSAVIRQLYSSQILRNLFNLKGKIMFENHGNSLNLENKDTELDVCSPQQSPVRKRQKKADKDGDALPMTPTVRSRSSRPRVDQFCVYNMGPEEAIPAYIIEYKAPHKLTKGAVEAGLTDMKVDEVVVYSEEDDPIKVARRRVAACISQAFSYMIQAGLEYGYICTGETFIFLRVGSDDPTTVYYYLSVPNDDVGETTGWVNGSDCDNRLHLTAIGQVLALTLRALKTPPRDQDWRKHAEAVLKKWEIEHDDILFGSDLEKSSSVKLSDYKQNQRNRNEYIRKSPIKTRSKDTVAGPSCRPAEEISMHWETSEDDSSGNGEYDPSSPSAGLPGRGSNVTVVIPPPKSTQRGGSTQASGQARKFCTQKCLLGLANGGSLDGNCPNVASHGDDKHTIDRHEFLRLARLQILREDPGPFGCESMHIHGASAALFKFTLLSYGYTLVTKGTPVDFTYSTYEEHLYLHLRPIQGIYIPVCLGSVDISSRPLYYDGIARIGHLLFLSHAGRPIKFHAGLANLRNFASSASKSLSEIHRLGILHRDVHNGNIFWNSENNGVMVIDFERAMILAQQGPMKKAISKKRKREVPCLATSTKKSTTVLFEAELKWMALNMT